MSILNKMKGLWRTGSDNLREEYDEARDDLTQPNGWIRMGAIAIAVYFFIALSFGFYWSWAPTSTLLQDKSAQVLAQKDREYVTGAATTISLITVVETLLYKPGGYLSNDVFPPSVWMDNIPSWEYGVIIQVRDMNKAMREAFSRSQSQSLEDKDLALAESRFNFDNNSWVLPATESQYKEGLEYINQYLDRLLDPAEKNAQFYARADNLRYWLSTVETRLGNLSQRLSASVGRLQLNTDLAGETHGSQATPTPNDAFIKTPWLELDNVFYEARGSTWALVHFLRAIEIDFAGVLEKKNARISLRQIIRELETSQQAIFSPVILNGSGFGLLANHSLVMASYISRANAAIIDLRELLQLG